MGSAKTWDALLNPLRFAAKDDFRNLDRVKDLGKTLARAAKEIGLPAELVALAEGIDAVEREEKKRRVLALLERIAADASTPSPSPSPSPKTLPRLGELKGVGESTLAALAERGVRDVRDLLMFLPRRYEDRRLRTSCRDAPIGERVTVTAEIRVLGQVPLRGGRKLFEMAVSDGTGILRLKWFRFSAKHFQKTFQPGMQVAVSGMVEAYQGQKQMLHPDLTIVTDVEALGDLPPIIPHYLELTGVHPKRLRSIIAQALPYAGALPDVLPPRVFAGRALPSLREALQALHQPPEATALDVLASGRSAWHERLILEELLLLQLGLVRRRMQASFEPGITIAASAVPADLLPFALTHAQQRVAAEIMRDLASGKPMHRLVQGDVGSGKTAVAFLAIWHAVRAGHQAAMMAPTELLSEQHMKNALQVLHKQGVRVALLTSSVPAAEAKKTLAAVKAGAIDVLIGTHALIQDRVEFRSLALAIIDEQHRFGVAQRAKLRAKGPEQRAPHLLVMTATPIPRTLALTVYGDLDVSIIDELPPGRTPVKTELVRETKREQLHQKMQKQLEEGRQIYVVYPLVEESEKVDLKDATRMAEEIRAAFPSHVVDLLHGRMPSEEKERVMRRLAAGETHVLVATTVIEVGIDVPNASVMVIEHADRFGLSQLHQLRGRVGRGAHKSYCYLVAGYAGEEAYRRLRILCDTNDGFRIAEEDLEIRGPGDFIGTRQAGLPELGVANLARDQDLLNVAKVAAEALLAEDAELARHPLLAAAVREQFRKAEQLALAG
ncbi:MAG: ATP-dependent DNA helicase RecG [Deltaproteobacteria bacterium]|nr:ATP-dependent DNA helicase RecG [Deltaproteobacteria bacterium]